MNTDYRFSFKINDEIITVEIHVDGSDHLSKIKSEETTQNILEADREKKIWYYDETMHIINTIGSYYNDIVSPSRKRRKKAWENIVNTLLLSFKIETSVQEIKKKWSNLVQAYNKTKDLKTRTGRGPTHFQFFDQIEAIIGIDSEASSSTQTGEATENILEADLEKKIWGYDETVHIINVIGSYYYDITSYIPELRKKAWENIVKTLLSFNIETTIQEIKKKWCNLVQAYNKTKYLKTRTGRGRTRFQFFDQIDAIIGIDAAEASSSTQTGEGTEKKLEADGGKKIWGYDETIHTINAIGNYYNDIVSLSPELRKKAWKNVVNSLLSFNIETTMPEIKKKWSNLVQTYTKAKELKTRTGRGPTRFQFFDEIDAIIGIDTAEASSSTQTENTTNSHGNVDKLTLDENTKKQTQKRKNCAMEYSKIKKQHLQRKDWEIEKKAMEKEEEKVRKNEERKKHLREKKRLQLEERKVKALEAYVALQQMKLEKA